MSSPLIVPSIYDGIEALGLKTDLAGWHSTDPLFAELIEEAQPRNIIEVGSWKGASAIHMARQAGEEARVFCVDTWLGGRGLLHHEGLAKKHGYPQVYFQFLHNVKACGMHERIVPVIATSRDGARILAAARAQVELIYIDGSHEEEDVADDVADYWPLLRPGGVMFGDDLNEAAFPGVRRAVEGFADFKGLLMEEHGHFWILRKPAK